MSGVIFVAAFGIVIYLAFRNEALHLGYRLFAETCEHKISWDMPCIKCQEEGRLRR